MSSPSRWRRSSSARGSACSTGSTGARSHRRSLKLFTRRSSRTCGTPSRYIDDRTHPGQVSGTITAPLVGVDQVTGPGELLLLHQQLLAGGEPFLGRHHLGQVRVCGHLGSSQSDVAAPGGPASTLGTYSSSCSRPSKVRLLTISRATSG